MSVATQQKLLALRDLTVTSLEREYYDGPVMQVGFTRAEPELADKYPEIISNLKYYLAGKFRVLDLAKYLGNERCLEEIGNLNNIPREDYSKVGKVAGWFWNLAQLDFKMSARNEREGVEKIYKFLTEPATPIIVDSRKINISKFIIRKDQERFYELFIFHDNRFLNLKRNKAHLNLDEEI